MKDDVAHWIRLPAQVYTVAADDPGSILLETSRFDSSNHRSYLFRHPLRVISVNRLSEIPRAFSQIEEALASGFHVAGYLAYECGYHFESFAATEPWSDNLPLAWLGVYDKPAVFDHAEGRFEKEDFNFTSDAISGNSLDCVSDGVRLGITQGDYRDRILKIKDYIAAGETYQVNFTDQVAFDTMGTPAAVYESLLKRQSVAYGALMNVAGNHILSFSPELFFRIDGRKIVTQPMKGTMPRGLNLAEDGLAILRLQHDEKNRAEHVMIVDLLRNDLGRICKMGSVGVDGLFSVEKYETLLQMTSTVSGTLRTEVGYYDIFRSLFPSGSVTGAPKIRTMQIIRSLEQKPRGIYTGAIGFISPNGSSVFNVAIRTLVMKDGHLQMGVGGGIVADSDPADEHRECLLKAGFLTRAPHDFQLIETMRWEREFSFLSLHLDRMESSATYFGFTFDRRSVLSRLHEASNLFSGDRLYRVRLLLESDGNVTIDSSELRPERSTGYVKLSPEGTSSADVFLRHKTTRRTMYDLQYAEARADGFEEVLFSNEKSEITEGAISNIFIELAGRLLTPPLSCGVLPGIFRRHLLETCATAEERVLTLEDLKAADAVFLCNSVRGVRRLTSLCLDASSLPHPRVNA